MKLRKFLQWSYTNADDRRLLIRRRLKNIHLIDTELERGFCTLKEYVKQGDYWYNCLKSPEKFWYLS